MMTVSAFGSSMARVCPMAVLVIGSRHVAVTDVNSRYLTFYTSDIHVLSPLVPRTCSLGTLLTECLRNKDALLNVH